MCTFKVYSFGFTAQWLSWLERRPVTAKVVGSSPIWVAAKGSGIAEWNCRKAEVQVLQALFLYAGMRLPHCALKTGAGDGTQVIMV